MADPNFQVFLSSQIGDLQRQLNVLQGRLSAKHQDEAKRLLDKISKLKADNQTLRHRLDIKPPPPEQDLPQPPPPGSRPCDDDDLEAFSDICVPKDEPVALAVVHSQPPYEVTVSASDDQGCWRLSAPAELEKWKPDKPDGPAPNMNPRLSQMDYPMPEGALTNASIERNSMEIQGLPFIADNSRASLSDEYTTFGDRGSVFAAPGEVHGTTSDSSEDEEVQAFSQKSSASLQSFKQVPSGVPGKQCVMAQISSCQRAMRTSFESDTKGDGEKHQSEGSDKNSHESSDEDSVKVQATCNAENNGDKHSMAFDDCMSVFSEKFPLHPVWTAQIDMTHAISEKRRRSMSTRSQTSNMTSLTEAALDDLRVTRCERLVMLRPNSVYHMGWDVLVLLAIIYDFVVIPLYVFDADQEHSGIQDSISTLNLIIRIFWLTDIPLQFATGFIDDKGRQHMNPKKIARRYASTWLLPDVACCAVEWTECILQASGKFPLARGILCACRMLRGQRLVRLSEAPELHEFMIEHIHNERVILTLSICRVVVLMAFYTHLIACGWYGLGTTSKDESRSVTKYNKIERMPLFDRYVWAFHCALGLFTGEHVAMPRSSRERVYTILVLFFTFMMTIWFVSTITTNMTRLQIMSGQRATQFSALGRYLADHHISRDLCIKVRRNAQYVVATQTKHTPEGSIELLSLISTPLRRELHFEVHSPLLTVHPFFRSYIDVYPTAIKKVCHEAIRLLTFSPGDIVFSEFEAPTVPRMFWVADGQLKYIQDVNQKQVCYGNWLSEALLWTKWTHRGTLESKTESELMALDATCFTNIVGNFPGTQVRNYATQFVKNLETTAEEEVSDVGVENREAEWLVEVAFGGGRQTRRTKSKGVRFHLASVHRASMMRGSRVENKSKSGTNLEVPALAKRITGGEELRADMANGQKKLNLRGSFSVMTTALRSSVSPRKSVTSEVSTSRTSCTF